MKHPAEHLAHRKRPSLSFQTQGHKVLRLESTGLGSNSELAAMAKLSGGAGGRGCPAETGTTAGRVERSLGEPQPAEARLCRRARSAFPSRPGLPSQAGPPQHLPGRTRASAPPLRAPALLRRSARGRHGSGGASRLAPSPAPLCSVPGWGPGGRDVPEPRAAASLRSVPRRCRR